jgi:erythromycin esterase
MRSLLSSMLVLAACAGAPTPPATPARPAAPAASAKAAAAPPPAPPTAAPAAPDRFAAMNLGFEEVDGELPRAWTARDPSTAASVTDEKHGGARALRLRGPEKGFGAAATKLDAAPLAGKHVRLRGWIKTEQAEPGAAIWLRVDGGPPSDTKFDNMFERRISGTRPWTAVAVEVDVPQGATTLVAGALMFGGGTAWFDDLQLEVSDAAAPAQVAIEGTVTDAAGAPAAGAEVALIGASHEIAQHVRAGADGRFRFDAAPGTWAVSAQRAGAVGAVLAPRRFAASGEVRIALGKDRGVTVRGKTTRPPPAGAYVEIWPADEDLDVQFAAPVSPDGAFEATLPRSDRYFVSLMGGAAGDMFPRRGDRVDAALVLPAAEPPSAEVVSYIVEHGAPLASVEAGKDDADLAPVGKLVSGARIVALGEATHGTREFFQMKHRLVEYLVARHGFTVFAIEANQPECRAINDYVLHGKGNARDALEGIYFWTWRTEEVLAMIEWMRAWNADPSHARKVQFTGFDMQATPVAHASVAAFLERVAPDQAKAWLAPLAPLADPLVGRRVAAASPDERGKLIAGLAALAGAFDQHRNTWAAAAGAAAFADARHDLTILQQATAMYAAKGQGVADARDRAMADNVGWLLEQTRAKIVVWAHDGHIASTLSGASANIGSYLRKRYQQAYVNLGFVFHEGSFQAMAETGGAGGPVEFTVGPAPDHYASAAFARAGKPLLVLDLRALPRRGPVRDWFAAPHPLREIGATFSDDQSSSSVYVLPKLFDAVIYVGKTTRARPLPPR